MEAHVQTRSRELESQANTDPLTGLGICARSSASSGSCSTSISATSIRSACC